MKVKKLQSGVTFLLQHMFLGYSLQLLTEYPQWGSLPGPFGVRWNPTIRTYHCADPKIKARKLGRVREATAQKGDDHKLQRLDGCVTEVP